MPSVAYEDVSAVISVQHLSSYEKSYVEILCSGALTSHCHSSNSFRHVTAHHSPSPPPLSHASLLYLFSIWTHFNRTRPDTLSPIIQISHPDCVLLCRFFETTSACVFTPVNLKYFILISHCRLGQIRSQKRLSRSTVKLTSICQLSPCAPPPDSSTPSLPTSARPLCLSRHSFCPLLLKRSLFFELPRHHV